MQYQGQARYDKRLHIEIIMQFRLLACRSLLAFRERIKGIEAFDYRQEKRAHKNGENLYKKQYIIKCSLWLQTL